MSLLNVNNSLVIDLFTTYRIRLVCKSREKKVKHNKPQKLREKDRVCRAARECQQFRENSCS